MSNVPSLTVPSQKKRSGFASCGTCAPLILLLTLTGSIRAAAQELEPRAYSASPIGANFLLVGIVRSSGGVVFDPTVPVTDVHADINGATLGLGRTFNLAGRQALVTAALPYAWGDISGKVAEQAQSVTRSGLADARLKVSVNLWGTPALKPAEFFRQPPRTNIGASLSVAAPSGQYLADKLINIGTNRWAFKPEVGLSHPKGRWWLELASGVWLFASNDQFYPGESLRTQAPLFVFQAHVSYNVTRRAWAAFDATWYGGADVSVNDGPPMSRQNNTRLGGTLVLPAGARQSLKIAYSTGASTRTGSDFSTIAIAWQYLWFDRTRPAATK
jgi:Putative MetA-pathway of phenol degradation